MPVDDRRTTLCSAPHRRMIPGGPGFRVGDNDTTILNAEGEHEPAPMYITNQPIVTAFPSVWVVRRSDMQMIADQGRGNFYLSSEMIIRIQIGTGA